MRRQVTSPVDQVHCVMGSNVLVHRLYCAKRSVAFSEVPPPVNGRLQHLGWGRDLLKSSKASFGRYLPAFWLSRSATPLSFLQQRGSPQSAIDPGRRSVTPGYLFTLTLLLEVSILPSKYSGSQWVSERWRTVRGLDNTFLFEMRFIIRFSS